MLGLDTGYFLRLLKGDTEAIRIWTAIIDGAEAAVSCLTLFEIARFARKGSIEAEAEETLREGILGLCRVFGPDFPLCSIAPSRDKRPHLGRN